MRRVVLRKCAVGSTQTRCASKRAVPNIILDSETTTRRPEKARYGDAVVQKAARKRETQARNTRSTTMVDRYMERVEREKFSPQEKPENRFASTLSLDTPKGLSYNSYTAATTVMLESPSHPSYINFTIRSGSLSHKGGGSALPYYIRTVAISPENPAEFWKGMAKKELVPGCAVIPTSYWNASVYLPEGSSPERLTETPARKRFLASEEETSKGFIAPGAGDSDIVSAEVPTEKPIYGPSPFHKQCHSRSGGDYPAGWDMNQPGAIYTVYDRTREVHGWGVMQQGGSKGATFLSMLNWDGESGRPTYAYWKKLIMQAYELRATLIDFRSTSAYRLLNGVGDNTPGLVVDVYGPVAVVIVDDPPQLAYAVLLDILDEMNLNHILVHDVHNRLFLCNALDTDFPLTDSEKRLPLPNYVPLASPHWVKGGVTDCTFHENGVKLKWSPNTIEGAFTGHYLHHRTIRQLIMSLAKGKSVLDLFSYTGSMGIAALQGGAAKVTFVESDKEYCAAIEANLSLLMPETEWSRVCRVEQQEALAYKVRQRYDIVILDPPDVSFEYTDEERASEGQKRYFEHAQCTALNRLKKGGKLIWFCNIRHLDSGKSALHLSTEAAKFGLNLTVLRTVGLGIDFPQDANRTEANYLGVIMEVM